ncbi:MAG: DUF4331 family protein [Candidatus Hydrogenedentota bacterium]
MKLHVPIKAKAIGVLGLSLAASISLIVAYGNVDASDHDDGEAQLKSRALNLTDLYVFKESSINAAVASDTSLIFIMGTNPRSVARTQYAFNPNAYYQFHIARRDTITAAPKGTEDVILRFQFSDPATTAGGRQTITVTYIKDGVATSGSATGLTSLISPPAGAGAAAGTGETTVTSISFGTATESTTIQVFAGLREDPFFFDVEQFHRSRNGIIQAINPGFQAGAPLVGMNRRPDSTSLDFAKGYNINAIVVRVPRAMLQSTSNETVFDVWETISL